MVPQVTVLVVEDNAAEANLIRERLESSGLATFVVRVATRLDEARRVLESAPVDVIVTDLRLPDAEGVEAVAALREVARGAPIIAVTGNLDMVGLEALQDAGVHDAYDKSETNNRLFHRCVLQIVERGIARKAQAELELLLSAMPDAILVLSRKGEVLYVNEGALRLFRRRREDFLGELLGFSVQPDGTSEVTILCGPNPRLCQVRVAQIEWRGSAAMLAALRDITDQRSLETQLALTDRLVALGTLAAGVAHEINNPLAAMMTNLELVQADLQGLKSRRIPVPEDVFAALEDTKEAARRVRNLVVDLKFFGRSHGDERSLVDVHAAIESTMRIASAELKRRACVVIDLEPVPPILANEGRVGQVLLNLVVNAAQAIPEGDVERNEVRVSTRLGADGMVEIRVADTGSGMSPEVLARIFTTFFTTKPAGEGTGLGLAISQKIVLELGGRIDVESAAGRGTTFTIRLPRAPHGSIQAEPAARASLRPPQRRVRVLVIDDDTTLTRALVRALSSEHEVVATNDGHHALEVLKKDGRFDVILCDLMMPSLSGMDLFRLLEVAHPELRSSVAFMTGGTFSGDVQGFLSSVPNPRIEKPFDVTRLRALINEVISRPHPPT